MKPIKSLSLCALFALCSLCASAYDFSAKNDGVTIYYNIVSSTDRTCEVTYSSTAYNTYLGSVAIPETVTRSSNGSIYTVIGIGNSAFQNSSGLTNVEMPSTITYIDDGAFYKCRGLTGELKIPDSVTTIGEYAFYSCTGLTSLTLGKSLTSIGGEAFMDCTTLSEITIPSSVTSIGTRAFIDCTNLTKVTLEDGEETLTMTTSSSYTPFTSYSSSYKSCPIETLYLGRNMSYTSPYAPFREQTTLKSLTIGEDVTTIGGYAFYGCTALEGVSIPNSVTSIEDYAFYTCRRMSYANISEGVETIGKYAFYQCYALTELTIPNSVTTIGNYAFYACTNLTSLTIGNSVTTIGTSAFYQCRSLTGELKIPDSVTTIGNKAFEDCWGMTSLTIGNSVTTIGERAFYECWCLTGELKLPDSVTTIGGCAFEYCSGLTSLTIGNSVTTIGEYAFYYCSGLTMVIIGNSVTTIGEWAFENCSELESFYSLNPEPPTCGSGVFWYVEISTSTLYVPKGAKEAYASADTWKNFYEIIEILPIDELYEKLSEEISSTKDFFEETWTSITEDYPDVVDEFREEYNDLINELTQLLEQLKEYFENDELDYDKAIQIRSELEELTKEIEDLVEKAIKANWSYDFFVEGIYYNVLSSSSLTVEAMYAETNSPYSGMVIIPATVEYNGDTYTVSTIAETPFSYINGIESITIPSSISTIGQKSFSNCTNITNVICEWENPSNVSVSESSFNGVYSTATLYVPTGTSKAYQSLAPWNLFSSIEEYDPVDGRIKYNITNGGATIASYQSTDLEGNITIPENVISEGANFKVIEVGTYAFNECRNIINVSLPDCVTKIGDYAFRACNNMENTPIPSGVTYIGTGAFEGCYSITSAVIPYGINEIRVNEFYDCMSLADVSIPETVSTINGNAFGYCAFTTISIPEAVTYIGDYTFQFCPNLSEITIPDKVTTLDIGAIRYCTSLKEVTLGESVNTLEDYVFVGCENLEKITSYNPEPPTCGEYVFHFVDTQTCILYVPKGAKEAYSSADTWKDFYNIEEKDFVTENLHNDLLNDIETVQETLEFSWNVIKTDYSDVANEFESEYASLVEELKKLLEELEDAYNDGTLDETLAEEIRAKLEEIRQQIEELLEAAKNAHDALDGIESINIDSSIVQDIYTIDGKAVDAPQRGVNIVRYSDGSTKKLLVK